VRSGAGPANVRAMFRGDIDALLSRIRQLVSERDARRGAGAGRPELEQRNAEIAHLHSHLAERVRRGLREETAPHGTRA
jgi:hypothetical protein